ncbi:hypothetical protein Fmac_029888 [Flemingia macrophylla]|uniref:Uncharacterized protein n=1 Tax=Flemingia macrophylla TaxID=520843 RepID=A0ABD1LBM9_9FABA
MGNRNSSNSKARCQATRTETGYDSKAMMGAKFREEYISKPKAETLGVVYSDNTPLDNDDTFTGFIRRAKYKIRTVSHIDQEQMSNAVASAPPAPPDTINANLNDEFSNFIVSAKKKMRSTSSIRKNNGSFKRG